MGKHISQWLSSPESTNLQNHSGKDKHPGVPSVKGEKKPREPRKNLEAMGDPERSSLLPPPGAPEFEKIQVTQEGPGWWAGTTLLGSPQSRGLRATATSSPLHSKPSRGPRLAYRPLGKGPAALWGSPALPQISWWG